MNADGEIEIDLPPVFVEKEVTLETFEVGIQTDEIELKYLLQDSIDQRMAEVKNKNQAEKKERKQNGFLSYSEDSTVVEENESSEVDSS